MFCTHCGTQVNDTDLFCPECGAKIERPAETTPSSLPDGKSTSPYTGEASPAPAPKKKSHKGLWIALTCIALALAVAAVVIFVWHPWSRCGARENAPVSEATNPPMPEPTAEPIAELTPEETVYAAFTKNQTAQSMHTDFSEDFIITISVPAAGYTQEMKVLIELGADGTRDPEVSRSEGRLDYMGQTQNILVYAERIGDVLWTYTSTDDGKTWKQEKNKDVDNSVLSDPSAAIDLWMKHAKEFREIGSETLDGVETTVYSATIAGEFVQDAMGATGSMFGDADEDVLKDLSDLPITIWIDNESGYVVRTTVDMQDMMKALLERSMQESMDAMPENTELSIDVSKALVDCRISQFNAVPPIVIPDEARGNILAPEPKPEPEPKPAEESIVGTWVLFSGEDGETQSYVDLMISLGMSMEFVFNADGTGSLSMIYGEENDFEEFTYTIENGQIVINGSGAPYRIEDGMLHLTADDVALVFKRK